MWKYILIGLGTAVLELILLALFSSWFSFTSELSGIIVGVGLFLTFEMVICTGVILSKIEANKDKKTNSDL